MTALKKEHVLSLHQILTARTGGSALLRDEGLLESALHAPFQSFGGQDLYPTLEEKGARLGFSLISNHASADGNKRIGILAMLTFFKINGVVLCPTQEDVIRAGLGVASGEMDYDDLLLWVKNSKKR
ncbi:MAG: type II toxin-antitoxin system death-on-curing family toxin [Clostridia bacterium]|nr:type II toxin-antitoxin system death-on-curing family toxin [Clostridia bacterium]